MQQKKNIKLGIIDYFILVFLLINISFLNAQEIKNESHNILIEINVLDKVSSKNTILKLNLGEEKNKGNMLTQSKYKLMEDNPDYQFIGNIEGRDIFNSQTDVIVCDGFTGNIVIKEAEAFYNLISKERKWMIILNVLIMKIMEELLF